MKKTTMNTKKTTSLAVRFGSILAATLMVILPVSGAGNLASAALAVPSNQDVTLFTFTINGSDVQDGDVVYQDYGTSSVDVVAQPNNVDASVEVNGDSGLVTGANELDVVVTSADDSISKTYKVTINVAANNDTSLGVFAVNGNDVSSGDTVNLDYGTEEVDVLAEPSDVEATLTISGNKDLKPGENSLVVTVYAADGVASITYTVKLVVAQNSDASLGVFAVNGNDVFNGDVISLPYGTEEVDVLAEPSDVEATLTISGNRDLAPGTNFLTVTVTAADGETKQVYTVTLNVARNDDTSLSSFAVDGNDVVDGDVITVVAGTTSVNVIAEGSDPNATVSVSGGTELKSGINTITVVVTAANGVDTATYKVTVVVSGEEVSSDTSLKVFKVDGKDVVDGGSVTIAQGRTSVEVEAQTTSIYATAVIAGNTGLKSGPNPITVTVKAEDDSVKIYTVTVTVALPSADTSLSQVKINGKVFSGALDGTGEYVAPYGSSAIVVVATPTSNAASVEVTGTTGLTSGETSIVKIAVTAENGDKKNYTFKVTVAEPNSDTSLSSIKVNGTSVTDGATVQLAYGTSAVSVEIETSYAGASYTIEGNDNLKTGSQTLAIHVTAESGAKETHTVTLLVAEPSAVTTIKKITVNGEPVTDNTITLPVGTTNADVIVELVSEFAKYSISGNSSVSTGTTVRTITVTAQDGVSVANTDLSIIVPEADKDNSLKGITVDGDSVIDGGSVQKDNGTTSVSVVATANSDKATVGVSGNTSLHSGRNKVIVTITSEAGVTANYSFDVIVAPSSDTSVKAITVNSSNVTSSKSFKTELGAESVSVVVTTTDPDATYEVKDATGLHVGLNKVTILVTASDSTTTKSYVLDIIVPGTSSDNELKSLKIDGVTVSAGATISKPSGTKSVVPVVTVAEGAFFQVSGAENLIPGDNSLKISVTAENGATEIYNVTIKVASADNTNLSSLKVNGSDVLESLAYTTGLGVNQVAVTVVTADSEAIFEVSGDTDLKPGSNPVTVTVTAADGVTTSSYVINVTVPSSSNDVSLKTLKVDGVLTTDGSIIEKQNGTASVSVEVETNSVSSIYSVSGETGLRSGSNLVTITVTAESGTKATYSVTILVAGSSDTTLSGITVNGLSVEANGTIDLEPGTTSATVVALTKNPAAKAVVSGADALESGLNTVTVSVTAEDQSVKDYHFTINVLKLSSNTQLDSITINGITPDENGVVEVSNVIDEAAVVAQTTSANATYEVTSSTALVEGDNTITLVVTAQDGVHTQTYNFTVKRAAGLSSEVGISGITVNDESVKVNGTYQAPFGTTQVSVDVITVDSKATFKVTGKTNLKTGSNQVKVTVTAENGDTSTYKFYVNVAKSSNIKLSSLSVDGKTLDLEAPLTYQIPNSATSVSVLAVAEDIDATVVVTGSTDLGEGDNDVVVTVIAADNVSSTEYTIVVNRAPLSGNTDLESIKVNGEEVAEGGSYEVDAFTDSVSVVATPAEIGSAVTVSGNTGLKSGDNLVKVTVTAPNGSTRNYIFTVVKATLSNDTTLSTFTIDGQTVVDGDEITLDGTRNYVTVIATPSNNNATVKVTGATDLAFYPTVNLVKVTVTAEDGSHFVYTASVIYPDIADASLSEFTVNGEDVLLGGEIKLPSGTETVDVVVKTRTPIATYEIEGGTDLQPGENSLVVTVTAADG
ncbi:MAG: hypothetical protein EBQ61_03070, partial [Micrococcales bacterium]|nr:hypothetical protein [Micrococcales bacterium]